jgi:hypothetical protein
VFVEVDADKHPNDAQDVDLNAEPKHELDQDEVNGQGWVNARREMSREDALDSSLRRHDVEDLSKNSTKQAADQHKHEKHPGRFSHAAAYPPCGCVYFGFVGLERTISEGLRHVNKTTDL